MNLNILQAISVFGFFTVLIFIAGAYSLIVTRNLLRTIIALELLIKAVTLLLVLAGYLTGNIALAQSLIITVIVVEVIIVVIAGGIVLSIFRHNGDLDVRRLQKLKG
jgi:NADH:ubiquinone oxidoreductase subunit K